VNRKIILLGVAVAALLVFSHVALAFGGFGMRSDRAGTGCPGGFWGDLGLSSSQASTIEALRKEFILETADLVTELRLRMAELWRLRVDEDADPAAMEAKRQEVQDLREQLQALRESHRQELMEVLTPDQQEALETRGPGGCFGRKGMGRFQRQP